MDENLRKSLIYILKNSKLYFLDIDNEKEKIYDKSAIIDDINVTVENIDLLIRLNQINEVIPNNDKFNSNFYSLIEKEKEYLDELLEKKSLLVCEDTSLEEISNQILNLDNPNYSSSMLYKLQDAKKQGIDKEYQFIRHN